MKPFQPNECYKSISQAQSIPFNHYHPFSNFTSTANVPKNKSVCLLRRLVSRRFVFARFLVSNTDLSPLFLHQLIYAFLAPRSRNYKNYFFHGWFCMVNRWLIGSRPRPKACDPGSILVPCGKSSFFPLIFFQQILYTYLSCIEFRYSFTDYPLKGTSTIITSIA